MFYKISFLICFSLFCQGQTLLFKGIISSNEQEPVSYASIQIPSAGIGAMSNELGEFEFYLPDSLKDLSIRISCIGYESKNISIVSILQGLNEGAEFDVRLAKSPINLESLTVLESKVGAEELVRTALKSIPANFSKKPFYLSGFYREHSIENNVYKHLLEADFSVFDFGINTSVDRTRIEVNELRKSDLNGTNSLFTKFLKALFNKQNNLVNAYAGMYERTYRNEGKSKTENTSNNLFEWYNFKLSQVIGEEERVFVIDAIPTIAQGKQGVIAEFHRFFIQENTKKILRHEVYLGPQGYFESFLGNDAFPYQNNYPLLFERSIYQYNDNSGKLYPSFIQHIKYKGDHHFETHSIFFYETVTKKEGFQRIKRKYVQRKEEYLHEQDFEYKPSFWNNYNMIALNPLNSKISANLEENASLEDQFIKNGATPTSKKWWKIW